MWRGDGTGHVPDDVQDDADRTRDAHDMHALWERDEYEAGMLGQREEDAQRAQDDEMRSQREHDDLMDTL